MLRCLKRLKETLTKKVRTDLQEIYEAHNKTSEKLRELLEVIAEKIEELYKENETLRAKIKRLEERNPKNDGK